ncbi:glycosyltransferase [Paraburkholderia sediminicola]|uniref:glycosyltransferase n=1 Tax=Paraburkholderia sediminicola TaxID=458836 RepID=UPI0038BE06F1
MPVPDDAGKTRSVNYRGVAVMRILHVTEAIKGGIASYLDEVASFQRFESDVEQVNFLLPAGWRTDIKSIVSDEVIEFRPVSRNRLKDWKDYCLALKAAIVTTRPDVVHLHSTFPGFIGRPLLRILRFKGVVIYQPHGWSFEMDAAKPLRAIYLNVERLLQRWCSKIICLTNYEYGLVSKKRFIPTRLAVIRTGLNEQCQSGEEDEIKVEGKLKLLFVGRMDRQKGVDNLLKVMSAVRRNDIELTIVGAPSKKSADFEIPKNVQLLGWIPREKLGLHFGSSDAVVMPSRWEGLPLVALESFRAGTPVIASSIGALTEIVIPGTSGFTIDFEDHERVVEFFEKLDGLVLRALRPSCKKWFHQNFRSSDMNKKIMNIYRSELSMIGAGANEPVLL